MISSMQRTIVTGLNATEQRITPPTGCRSLDHVLVTNSSDAIAYLNFWIDSATTGSPALAIGLIADQIAVPIGVTPLLMDLGLLDTGSLVISASQAAAGTGDPSVALTASLRWGEVRR